MNVSLKQCLKSGYTIAELKAVDKWFVLRDFVSAGCSFQDLWDAGYSLEDLGGHMQEFLKAGCSPLELFAAGYSLQQLTALDFEFDETLWKPVFESGKYSLQELKTSSCPGRLLREFGVLVTDLCSVGYLLKDL